MKISIFLPSLSFISSTIALVIPQPGVLPADGCDCYLVSGPDPGYFTNYQFWDFRDVPLVSNTSNNREVDTILLAQSPFHNDWQAQSWRRNSTRDSTFPMVNSERNAFFAKHPERPNATSLLLRTTRLPEYSYTAEIESRMASFFHCSLRVRMRIMSEASLSYPPKNNFNLSADQPIPRGACAGVFTYRSATCESDLEILTSDPQNTIHYGNQPDYDPISDTVIPGSSRTVTTLPAPWTTWVTHRIDWFPDATRWFADNQLQSSITYGVPDRPSIISINLWSDGGVWTGDMSVGESVYLGIEWIEIAYNLSTTAPSSSPVDTAQRHRHRPAPTTGSLGQKVLVGRDEEHTKADGLGSCQRLCALDDMYPR